MTRSLGLCCVIAFTSACIYVDAPDEAGSVVYTYADAGCYWDPPEYDYIVYFDVDVFSTAGPPVVEVWADVYDDRSGQWMDGFTLDHEQGDTWFSAWIGRSTWTDCENPYQSVDITARTADGRSGVVTVPLILSY